MPSVVPELCLFLGQTDVDCVYIFFVAFPVRPLGNINVFLEDCPVSIRSGSSSAGAAPEVAPESRKANPLNFLLCSFRVQCAATLLGGLSVTIADMAFSMLV